jgi:hypothetical protein
VRRGWVCMGHQGLRLGAVGALGFASAMRQKCRMALDVPLDASSG